MTIKKDKIPNKKIPKHGRKMSKEEAREYVFKEYHELLKLLAKK